MNKRLFDVVNNSITLDPDGVVRFSSNKDATFGEVLADMDGFYKWWPPCRSRPGYVGTYVLRDLADLVDGLNAEWQKQIDEYFDEEARNGNPS